MSAEVGVAPAPIAPVAVLGVALRTAAVLAVLTAAFG